MNNKLDYIEIEVNTIGKISGSGENTDYAFIAKIGDERKLFTVEMRKGKLANVFMQNINGKTEEDEYTLLIAHENFNHLINLSGEEKKIYQKVCLRFLDAIGTSHK